MPPSRATIVPVQKGGNLSAGALWLLSNAVGNPSTAGQITRSTSRRKWPTSQINANFQKKIGLVIGAI